MPFVTLELTLEQAKDLLHTANDYLSDCDVEEKTCDVLILTKIKNDISTQLSHISSSDEDDHRGSGRIEANVA